MTFKEQIIQFLQLVESLQEKGVKKKEMAKELDIQPSAFSGLVNKVLKPMKEADIFERAHISRLFEAQNNLSERKTRQKMNGYLSTLSRFEVELAEAPAHSDDRHFVDELLSSSPREIMNRLVGLYECYYVSSFGYRVKCEPFLIRPIRGRQAYAASKGNKNGPASYKGLVYITNTHLLTTQMLETGTISRDHFIAHFILPPTYDVSMRIIKGITVSMSNGYLPIGRKIILKKILDEYNLKAFEEMPTYFINREEMEEGSIAEYLYQSESLIEYYPIPRPNFDEGDLNAELAIQKALSKKV